MTPIDGLTVAVLTRGSARGADYRWSPKAPEFSHRDAWNRLTSVQEHSLLCEIRGEIATLELTGLTTGRNDDVGSIVVNSLGITCGLSSASRLLPGVVQVWLDLASGKSTAQVDGLLVLADQVDGDLSPRHGLEAAIVALASEVEPAEGSSASLPATSWLGDLSLFDHRTMFLRELRSMLREGQGTVGVINLVASAQEVSGVMAKPDGKLVVLGVDTDAIDGVLRPLHWAQVPAVRPEGEVTPGKARGRQPQGCRLVSQSLAGLLALCITLAAGPLLKRVRR